MKRELLAVGHGAAKTGRHANTDVFTGTVGDSCPFGNFPLSLCHSERLTRALSRAGVCKRSRTGSRDSNGNADGLNFHAALDPNSL